MGMMEERKGTRHTAATRMLLSSSLFLLSFAVLVFCLSYLCPSVVQGAITSYQRRRYDRRVNVFSPDGELLQSSYADVAADQGDLVVAAVAKDGSIIVCKPAAKESKLLVPRPKGRMGGDTKIKRINRITFATFSGLRGDSLAILSKVQSFTVRLKMTVRRPIGITTVATKMSELQYSSTLLGGERPYGVNMILIGHETEKNKLDSIGENTNNFRNKPKMFCINASGNIYQCLACATGKGASLALEELESTYSNDLEPQNIAKMLKSIARKCYVRYRGIGEGDDNEEDIPKFDVHILYADRPGSMVELLV